MPKSRQPVPYETLVRVQLMANELKGLGLQLEEFGGRLDTWVYEQLGIAGDGPDGWGPIGLTDYGEAVFDEFWRVVEAREGRFDDA